MKTAEKVRYSLRTAFEKRKKIVAVEPNTDYVSKPNMGRIVKLEKVRGGLRRMRGRPRTRELKQPSFKKQHLILESPKESETNTMPEESMSPTPQEPPQLEPMPVVEEDNDMSLICIDDHLRPGKCILLCPAKSCRTRFSNPLELVSHLKTYHKDVPAYDELKAEHGVKALNIYACPICLPTQFSTHTTSSDLTLLSEHAIRYHGKTLSSSDFIYFCAILLELVNKAKTLSKDSRVSSLDQDLKPFHKSSNTILPQVSHLRATKRSAGTLTVESPSTVRSQPKLYTPQHIILPVNPISQPSRPPQSQQQQPTFIPISPVHDSPSQQPITSSSMWSGAATPTTTSLLQPSSAAPPPHSMPVLALAASIALSTSTHMTPAPFLAQPCCPVLLPSTSVPGSAQQQQQSFPLQHRAPDAAHGIFLKQNQIPTVLLPTSATNATTTDVGNSSKLSIASDDEVRRGAHSTSLETAEAIATIQNLIASAASCSPSYPQASTNSPMTPTSNQTSLRSAPTIHRSPLRIPAPRTATTVASSNATVPVHAQQPVHSDASFLQPLGLGDAHVVKTTIPTTNCHAPEQYPPTTHYAIYQQSGLEVSASRVNDGVLRSQVQPLSCTVSSSSSGMEWEPDGQLSPSSGLLALACLSTELDKSDRPSTVHRSFYQAPESPHKSQADSVVKGRNRRLLPRKFNKNIINEYQQQQQQPSTAVLSPATTATISPVVCVTRRQVKTSELTSTSISKSTTSRKRGLAPLVAKPPKETTMPRSSTLITIQASPTVSKQILSVVGTTESSATDTTSESIRTCQALTELSSVVGLSSNLVTSSSCPQPKENAITVNSSIRPIISNSNHEQHQQQHQVVKAEENMAPLMTAVLTNVPFFNPTSMAPTIQPFLQPSGALFSPSKPRPLQPNSYVAVPPRASLQRAFTIRQTPLQKILPRPNISGTATGTKEVRPSRPTDGPPSTPELSSLPTTTISSASYSSSPQQFILTPSTSVVPQGKGNNSNSLWVSANLNGSTAKSGGVGGVEASVSSAVPLVAISSEGHAS